MTHIPNLTCAGAGRPHDLCDTHCRLEEVAGSFLGVRGYFSLPLSNTPANSIGLLAELKYRITLS